MADNEVKQREVDNDDPIVAAIDRGMPEWFARWLVALTDDDADDLWNWIDGSPDSELWTNEVIACSHESVFKEDNGLIEMLQSTHPSIWHTKDEALKIVEAATSTREERQSQSADKAASILANTTIMRRYKIL